MSLPVAGAPSCCGGGAPAVAPIRSEAELRAWLETDPAPDPATVLDLLREQNPLYDGLGSPEVVRIRGALLLALPRPLPEGAVPFVVEELESGDDAYLAAVAAHVLRRGGVPSAAFAQPLVEAFRAVRPRDEPIRLGIWGGHGTEGPRTTAIAEILETLTWLGGHGRGALDALRAFRAETAGPKWGAALDRTLATLEAAPAPKPCCGGAPESPRPAIADPTSVADLELQDQGGRTLRFADFFTGRPSVAAFFYTRCANPAKCPTTIRRMGQLRGLLRDAGLADRIRTAAITYDPAFDTPARLVQYGRSFGMDTDDHHRMLRTTGDFAPLRAWFELGVGYAGTVVNRHQLEVFVLDREGRIAQAITRRQWTAEELVEAARSLL